MLSPIRRDRRRARPAVEPLEGRMVLSHASPALAVAALKAPRSADGSGAAAILNALNGGAGSEFVTLIRRGTPNPTAILRQFMQGTRTEFSTKGFAVVVPKFPAAYTGPHLDQYSPQAAGAVKLADGRLELAAIMRGPIDLPAAVNYTWGIDRGAGLADPQGTGNPGLRFDAAVTVTRANGVVTASVVDLRTGVVTPLDPSSVLIQGPTIRVFLSDPATQLPSTGKPLEGYRFAFWTRSGPNGVSDIGGFVPTSGTIPIGVLAPARPARRR